MKISERDSIIFSFIIYLLFFVFTYPWSFIKETIPYFHPEDDDPIFNRTIALLSIEADNSTEEFVGCNVDYEWCQFTPRINIYIFTICLFLASGLAYPIINLNLDILVSKVLGPINQGIQQAIFNIAGLLVNIFGPPLFT
uniref:Uncharacterized protein n=1 Tax=Panagrolaimus sp. JU765 TaxID=591449 RepID=A0AC34Q1W3_9BILA